MGLRTAQAVGLLSVAVLAWGAKLPSTETPLEVLQRFSFQTREINPFPQIAMATTREVHPELKHIQPWIASVGAGAAIGDLTGALVSQDYCVVDTRLPHPIVGSTRGTFPAFELPHAAKGYAEGSTAPMGCLMHDLNEDGLTDILVYYWGKPLTVFLQLPPKPNQPITPSSFRPVEIGAVERWFTNAVSLADLDGDGHTDIVVGNYFCDGGRLLEPGATSPACDAPVMQDSMSRAFNGGSNRILLWRGGTAGADPQVSFSDHSEALPELISRGWTLAIGMQDLTGDLLPDIYFANDFGPDRLLINCSRSQESFGQSREALGCFPLQGPVSFRLVHGQKTFLKPSSKVLGRDSYKGMGVDFADLNGDGIPDIFVSNITDKWALQESQFVFLSNGKMSAADLGVGTARYSDESEHLGMSRSGWAWDAKFADFDNDGVVEALQAVGFVKGQGGSGFPRKSCWAALQELATSNDNMLKYAKSWFNMRHGSLGVGCDLSGDNRNPFFVRSSGGRYIDVADQLDHLRAGQSAVTRGLAIGDVNQDGLLDYIEAKQYGIPLLHINTSKAGAQSGYVSVTPRFRIQPGRRSEVLNNPGATSFDPSRAAIGTTVKLILSDKRVFTAQVDGGNGHSGKRAPDVHFGIGRVQQGVTAKIRVEWRAGPDSTAHSYEEVVPLNTHSIVMLNLEG